MGQILDKTGNSTFCVYFTSRKSLGRNIFVNTCNLPDLYDPVGLGASSE